MPKEFSPRKPRLETKPVLKRILSELVQFTAPFPVRMVRFGCFVILGNLLSIFLDRYHPYPSMESRGTKRSHDAVDEFFTDLKKRRLEPSYDDR